jgi:hypothetical protein
MQMQDQKYTIGQELMRELAQEPEQVLEQVLMKMHGGITAIDNKNKY